VNRVSARETREGGIVRGLSKIDGKKRKGSEGWQHLADLTLPWSIETTTGGGEKNDERTGAPTLSSLFGGQLCSNWEKTGLAQNLCGGMGED